jgi:hypothetical protein
VADGDLSATAFLTIAGACAALSAFIARTVRSKRMDALEARVEHVDRLLKVSMRAQMMIHEGYGNFIKRTEPEIYREVIGDAISRTEGNTSHR